MGSSGGTIVITADRHEVAQAVHWDDSSGSDYFFEPDLAGLTTTGNAESLVDVGWTVTGLGFVQGTSGDFFGAAGLDPSHYEGDNATDKLESPNVFGDYFHSQQAAHHLGQDPTTLTMEMWAQFTVTSASETGTALGFFIGGGSIVTEADHVAAIHTDGTNFICREGGGDTDAGALDDESWHLFKIVISIGSVTDAIEWFIDGTSQGTLNRRTDAYPCGWGAGNSTTNRIQIGPCRIFYR